MDLTSVDLHYVVKELQKIIGAKVEKVYQSQVDRMDFLIQLYLRDWPKLFLRLNMPGFICLQDEKPAYPREPPAFAMFLRKYIGGARLTAVRQHGFDRVLVLEFQGKHGNMNLTFEVLPPGNAILVMDGKVKNLAQQQSYQDRKVRGGVEYIPPATAYNLKDASEEDIVQRLMETTRESIVKALAITTGLGGLYAEEVCARADIDKNRSDLNKEELQKIVETIKSILVQDIIPHSDENRVYPFKMESRPCEKCSEDLMLKAMNRFAKPTQDKAQQVKAVEKQKSKAVNMLVAQEKQLKILSESAEQDLRKGELIYENYQTVDRILRAAKEGNENVLKQIKGVKKFHKKTGEIEVEF